MTDLSNLLYTLTRKSLLFHIPEAWKRYPFRAEPPRMGHYRKYLLPGRWDSKQSSLKQKFPKTFQFNSTGVVSRIKSPLCCKMTIIWIRRSLLVFEQKFSKTKHDYLHSWKLPTIRTNKNCLYRNMHKASFTVWQELGFGNSRFCEIRFDRAEKSLSHVLMVAKFLDANKPKIHLNREFALFKLNQTYSISFNLSNVGEIFWGWIRKDRI